MNIVKLWFLGITKPGWMFDELINRPAPLYGFYLVLARFTVTTLTSILALYLLHRVPFTSSYLTFLSEENYYKAELFFLPLWGLAVWMMMGGVAYLIFRSIKKEVNFDHILNIIAAGMIIPMPFLWLYDWGSIATQHYAIVNQAVSHSISQIWEGSIQFIGFKRIIGIKTPVAVMAAIIINIVYILFAIVFVR